MSFGGGLLLTAERRQRLIAELQTHGRIEVGGAAKSLGTSTETIRKDLVALEQEGLLTRVHGGAIPVHSLTYEPSIEARTENLPEKQRIASRAIGYVPSEGAIFVDAGSTTEAFAEALPPTPSLQVFTNALTVAQSLVRKNFTSCHTLGGRIRPNSLAEVGAQAQNALSNYRFDVGFVGTNAISFDRGLCTPDPEEAAIKRLIIKNSERVVLLADHTKFGQDSLVAYAALNDISTVVTGDELDMKMREHLSDYKTEVEFV